MKASSSLRHRFFEKRPTTITNAYGLACLAGAAGMFAYLTVGLDRGSLSQSLKISSLVGFLGGLVALPFVAPLIHASERWRWRNPLVYLSFAPLLYAVCSAFGFFLVLVSPWRFLPIPLDDFVINPAHAFHPLALRGYQVSMAISVAVYWVLRGRVAGTASRSLS